MGSEMCIRDRLCEDGNDLVGGGIVQRVGEQGHHDPGERHVDVGHVKGQDGVGPGGDVILEI